MKFTDFYRNKKNVLKDSFVRRISSSIPIDENREEFYKNGFKKYDWVESDGIQYRILEKCSNYYRVVDLNGVVHRKFEKQLTESINIKEPEENTFHGYLPVSEQAKFILESNKLKIQNKTADDVGILKQLKEADAMEKPSYQPKDKLTVAKIIADTVGVPHDNISTPENLVAAAIRKARKDPVLMKNKAILANMLQIAREVGIKYSDETFEVKESKKYDPIHGKEPRKGTLAHEIWASKIKHDNKSKEPEILDNRYGNALIIKRNVKESEDFIPPEPVTLKALRKKLNGNIGELDTDTPVEDKLTDTVLPNGHSLNATSNTHRRQLINKLMGHQ